VHIGIFLVLTYIICWVFRVNEKKWLLLIFLSGVLYGISVEFIQDYFVVNRSFDLGDWAADIAGSFFGIWIWNLRYIKK
jgi:VanZ family protein